MNRLLLQDRICSTPMDRVYKVPLASSLIQTETVILGIDPGTATTGWGVISAGPRNAVPISFGAIRPKSTLSQGEKYLCIFDAVEEIVVRFAPKAFAVESQFVYKNAATAMKLGMARASAMLAAARHKVPIYEYTPTKAKLAVAGNGAATKEQVQKMIALLLGLSSLPEPHDAADALALALCHAHNLRWRKPC